MAKIYIAQIQPVLFEKEKNLSKMNEYMQKAAEQKAELILFPELALTGYFTRGRTAKLAEDLNGPSIRLLSELANKYRIKTVFGFPERISDAIYNSACFINDDGTILGSYQKIHLWDEEHKYFSTGQNPVVFDTDIGKIGLMICYDMEFPEAARLLALGGAEMILVPTANMIPYEHLQKIQVPCRAAENQLYVITTNRVGTEESTYFFGESAVADPYGNHMITLEQSESGHFIEFDLNKVKQARNFPNYFHDRRSELYSPLAK